MHYFFYFTTVEFFVYPFLFLSSECESFDYPHRYGDCIVKSFESYDYIVSFVQCWSYTYLKNKNNKCKITKYVIKQQYQLFCCVSNSTAHTINSSLGVAVSLTLVSYYRCLSLWHCSYLFLCQCVDMYNKTSFQISALILCHLP